MSNALLLEIMSRYLRDLTRYANTLFQHVVHFAGPQINSGRTAPSSIFYTEHHWGAVSATRECPRLFIRANPHLGDAVQLGPRPVDKSSTVTEY